MARLKLCPVCSAACADGVALRIHLASRHSPQEYRLEVRRWLLSTSETHAVEVIRGEARPLCSRVELSGLSVLHEVPGSVPTCGRCRLRLPSGVGALG